VRSGALLLKALCVDGRCQGINSGDARESGVSAADRKQAHPKVRRRAPNAWDETADTGCSTYFRARSSATLVGDLPGSEEFSYLKAKAKHQIHSSKLTPACNRRGSVGERPPSVMYFTCRNIFPLLQEVTFISAEDPQAIKLQVTFSDFRYPDHSTETQTTLFKFDISLSNVICTWAVVFATLITKPSVELKLR